MTKPTIPPTDIGHGVTLTSQTVRRCIICRLPITFAAMQLPFLRDRRHPEPIAYVWSHPTEADCTAEAQRREPGQSLTNTLTTAIVRRNDTITALLDATYRPPHVRRTP